MSSTNNDISMRICFLACLFFFVFPKISAQETPDGGWPYYGHDAGGMRYSPLTRINRDNVSKLKVAWVFHTGELQESSGDKKRSGFETTPILVDGTLYITTPFNRVIALDPATGKQRWA